MTTLDLTDEEEQTLIEVLREALDNDRFPLALRPSRVTPFGLSGRGNPQGQGLIRPGGAG